MTRPATVLAPLAVTALLGSWPGVGQGAENLLQDADLERDVAAEDGGWIHFDGSRVSTDHARSGQRSTFNWGYSRNNPTPPHLTGRASGSYQEFPATANSHWRLTGFAMTPTPLKGYPAFGVLQLSFFDAEGKDLGTVETEGNVSTRAKVSNEVNRKASAGEWLALDTGVATAPAGTATVQAFTLFVDYSAASVPQGVYFDDLQLCETDSGGTCLAE